MINLKHGDCLELMKSIPDKSIDMVLTDPPYGTTACKWDSIIPFDKMWQEIKRIVRNDGSAILLFGSEPFSSALRMSNMKEFKYDWIWDKVATSSGFLAKRQPLTSHELIHCFYKAQPTYNPQMWDGVKHKRGGSKRQAEFTGSKEIVARNKNDESSLKFPRKIIRFSNADKTNHFHPTQKPVALLEYLIKTYTIEGETVLDFTMGSGSTGVACKNLDRKFIGIEKDDKYFEIAKNRIFYE